MDQATFENTTISPEPCEISLRLRLRKAGMRQERTGYGYRLIAGNIVILARGANGFGLSLDDIERSAA